jgi:hypothetical protein
VERSDTREGRSGPVARGGAAAEGLRQRAGAGPGGGRRGAGGEAGRKTRNVEFNAECISFVASFIVTTRSSGDTCAQPRVPRCILMQHIPGNGRRGRFFRCAPHCGAFASGLRLCKKAFVQL